MTESHRKAHDAADRVDAVGDVLADLVPSDVDIFAADVRTQWAVEMGLIHIGEAVNRIPDDVLELFAEQPWSRSSRCATSPPTRTTTSTHTECGAPSPATFLQLRAYLVGTVIPRIDHLLVTPLCTSKRLRSGC